MLTSPPSKLLPWLLHNQFLTLKLQETAGDARLDVLDQRWESPDKWDQESLKLHEEQVMHREILMQAFEIPCWYGRTILPQTTFQANTTLFNRLKTESLGHLIFNGADIRRISLKHYPIFPTSPEYQWLNASMHEDAPALWMRLSEFSVIATAHPFFLAEIFLPGLLRYIS